MLPPFIINPFYHKEILFLYDVKTSLSFSVRLSSSSSGTPNMNRFVSNMSFNRLSFFVNFSKDFYIFHYFTIYYFHFFVIIIHQKRHSFLCRLRHIYYKNILYPSLYIYSFLNSSTVIIGIPFFVAYSVLFETSSLDFTMRTITSFFIESSKDPP